jgi:putative ABC transport system substrate-binding protein
MTLLFLMACAPATETQVIPVGPPRIAYLQPTRADAVRDASGIPVSSPPLNAFRRGLTELGYAEGENIAISYYFTVEGDESRLPEIAAQIVATNPAVIVAVGPDEAWAIKQATGTIPIVIASVPDPVERGFAQSYAHPEGNLTGVAPLSIGLVAKRLQLLHGAVPGISRVAILSTPGWDAPSKPKGRQWQEVQDAAASLGIDVFLHPVQDQGSASSTTESIVQAIAEIRGEGADAVYLLSDALFDTRRNMIAETARKYGLPTMYSQGPFAEAGGLMAYAPDIGAVYHRVAEYVDKILRGAEPRDLPIDQQSGFEWVINLDTAADLGIEMSASTLQKATRTIGGANLTLGDVP